MGDSRRRSERMSMAAGLGHTHGVEAAGGTLHIERQCIAAPHGAGQYAHVHEVAATGAADLIDEAEAPGGVEEVDLATAPFDHFLFPLGYTEFDLFGVDLLTFGGIGRRVHDHPVLVHVGDHAVQTASSSAGLALL